MHPPAQMPGMPDYAVMRCRIGAFSAAAWQRDGPPVCSVLYTPEPDIGSLGAIAKPCARTRFEGTIVA
jgi:hypothetical protein